MALFSGLMDNENDAGKRKMDTTKYVPFGDYAKQSFSEGWYPSTDPDPKNGSITYLNNYTNAFNDVWLPDEQDTGKLGLIGYPNQTFDIVIMNKKGEVKHVTKKGVSPEAVQDYLKNDKSIVASRVKDVKKKVEAQPMERETASAANILPLNY